MYHKYKLSQSVTCKYTNIQVKLRFMPVNGPVPMSVAGNGIGGMQGRADSETRVMEPRVEAEVEQGHPARAQDVTEGLRRSERALATCSLS